MLIACEIINGFWTKQVRVLPNDDVIPQGFQITPPIEVPDGKRAFFNGKELILVDADEYQPPEQQGGDKDLETDEEIDSYEWPIYQGESPLDRPIYTLNVQELLVRTPSKVLGAIERIRIETSYSNEDKGEAWRFMMMFNQSTINLNSDDIQSNFKFALKKRLITTKELVNLLLSLRLNQV